uniref:Uncharacterized protein n=1 Tax=Lepeophtheirus salmonis TaxID=72036 RepID=A0A0K2TDJ3_LEPSM
MNILKHCVLVYPIDGEGIEDYYYLRDVIMEQQRQLLVLLHHCVYYISYFRDEPLNLPHILIS